VKDDDLLGDGSWAALLLPAGGGFVMQLCGGWRLRAGDGWLGLRLLPAVGSTYVEDEVGVKRLGH